MTNESAREQGHAGTPTDPGPPTADWRNALVIDLAGRIRVARRRAFPGAAEARGHEPLSGPATGAASAE